MTAVSSDTIEPYFAAQIGVDSVTVTDLVQHDEGWSRNTYSFTASWEDNGEQASNRFTIRSESKGSVLDTPLEQEFRVMDSVQEADVPVPTTHWYESDDSIIGAPFFVVDHVEGDAPNTWRTSDREMLETAWEERSDLPEQFVQAAAGIHSISPDDVPFLDCPSRDEVVQQEIDFWTGKYDGLDLREEPIVDDAIRWFQENQPTVDELTLVHGDFRIGNMLIEDEDITAVLDWEMARIGDPHYDLGYSSMPYLAGKLLEKPTELACAVVDREWYYDRYEALTGREVDRFAVDYWMAFSIFVMITILLTGVDRYEKGESDDVRQVWLQYPVPGLLEDLMEIVRRHETAP